MRRTLFRYVLPLLMIYAGLIAAWFYTRPVELTEPAAKQITPEAFDRIDEGMTLEEVVAILGVPPGDYRKKKSFHLVGRGHIPWKKSMAGGKLHLWYIPGHLVEIWIDKQGHVVGKYWHTP